MQPTLAEVPLSPPPSGSVSSTLFHANLSDSAHRPWKLGHTLLQRTTPRIKPDCVRKFSAPRPQRSEPQRARSMEPYTVPRSWALPVRPLLGHPLQCQLVGRRPAAELHGAAEPGEEPRGDDHSHIHHGALLRHLRGGTPGQHPRHVRGGQVNTACITVFGFERGTCVKVGMRFDKSCPAQIYLWNCAPDVFTVFLLQ